MAEGASGLIGGTGPEGKGLAARFAKAGLDVHHRLSLGGARRGGGGGDQAAGRGQACAARRTPTPLRGADVVLVTVPYAGLRRP